MMFNYGKIVDGHYINNNTVSTINKNNNGQFVLRFYHKTSIVFEKEYKTMSSAKAAQTMKMKNASFFLSIVK